METQRRYLLLLITLLMCFPLVARELKVALADVDYGPFYFQQQDKIQGISIEILEQVLKRMEVRPNYQRRPWSRLLSELAEGRQDLVTVLYLTKQRKGQFAYVSPAYLTDSISLLCHKPCKVKFSGDLAELSGRYIGVTRNFSYGDKLDSETGLKRQTVEREPELFRLLSQGKLKLALASRITFLWSAGRHEWTDRVEILEAELDKVGIHFAFGRTIGEDETLTRQFTDNLKTYLQSEDYRQRLRKYQLTPYQATQVDWSHNTAKLN